MKKTKLQKIVAFLLAGTLGMTCMTGCNKTGENANGKTTITVSNWPNPESNPDEYERMTQKAKRFEEQNPDIHIVGDEWGYTTQTFAAKAEGGTLPTIYIIPFTETKKIMDLDYAVDVTQFVKDYNYYDIISDYCMSNISKEGKIFYIPDTVYSMHLLMNLNLMRDAGLMEADDTPKIPETYDELLEMARTITVKTGKPGFLFPTTNNMGGWMFTVFAWSFGAKFINQTEDGKWTANFATPECINALKFIRDMKWEYGVLPESTLINDSEISKLIGTDQAAMTISNLTLMNNTRSYGLDINNVGVAHLPAGPKKRVNLVGGSYYAFSPEASEEQLDAAFKWLTFENDVLNFDDAAKASMEDTIKTEVNEGYLVGIHSMSIWNTNSEYQSYKNSLEDKYCNVNPNHIKNINTTINGIEYMTEEPICTQDLYAALDACLQEVLTNENADCAAVLKQANDDFQVNYLDYE